MKPNVRPVELFTLSDHQRHFLVVDDLIRCADGAPESVYIEASGAPEIGSKHPKNKRLEAVSRWVEKDYRGHYAIVQYE